MEQWNFYVSGILYDKFFQEDEKIMISKLDVYSGKWQEKTLFSESESENLKKICHRDILSFFKRKKDYEEKIFSGAKQFQTSWNEQFQLKEHNVYIQRHKLYPMDLCFDQTGIYAVLMAARDMVCILVKNGYEKRTILKQWEDLTYSKVNVFPVQKPKIFDVQTKDHISLATDVYLPVNKNKSQFPTILVRTPYGKKQGYFQYWRFIQRGYAVVIQDVRGREESQGEWMPSYYEVEDANDTLNWIASQSWSDGCVGMIGASYLGYVQWAALCSQNVHLQAIVSFMCSGSAFVDIPRRGGCFNSGMLAWAFAMAQKTFLPENMTQDWDYLMKIRPISKIPEVALGQPIDFLDRWLKHENMDDFWNTMDWEKRSGGYRVPALIISGWFDDNGMGTTQALRLVKSWKPKTWKAIIGAWKHNGNAEYDLHHVYMGENALRYDIDLQCMLWLDRFVKGVHNGIEEGAPVEYYTLHENRWKTASTWPVSNHRVKLYLQDSDDKANGNTLTCGSGHLIENQPFKNGWSMYCYDPDNPAKHIIDVSENELEVPENYIHEEKRKDVLTFSTDILNHPITITGDFKVKLYVSCDCPDTDIVVRICDVDPLGNSIKLADGVLDLKYRDGFEQPKFLQSDVVYPIEIQTTKISNTFQKGHRIRLTITSSAENFIFPNTNTKEGFNGIEKRKANIRIYWGAPYISYIEYIQDDF